MRKKKKEKKRRQWSRNASPGRWTRKELLLLKKKKKEIKTESESQCITLYFDFSEARCFLNPSEVVGVLFDKKPHASGRQPALDCEWGGGGEQLLACRNAKHRDCGELTGGEGRGVGVE